ncbi:hypothetical protein CLU83_2130 [Flavobacterium sp. 1]|uniref:hypothetical protein n=1 Tax=Flavobacterium sp. 1 TaxID=2035200 RepID=UPI000C2471A3|nr:hypothetical protein [Flavobacterium sp. 1]PJJ08826.1 hypothetical protein CLU83_2130 [Flavobacterium sp. 1]
MIYSFNEDILSNISDSDIDSLDKIWINSKERHNLYIGDNRLYETIKDSNWYKGLRKSGQTYIDESLISSAYIKKSDIQVIMSNDNNHYSLIEANEILCKTFSLILENIEYDNFFFDSLIKNFKEESKKIKMHIEKGWLVPINGNGNNISNVLNEMQKRLNNASFPKHNCNYLRSFVIIDSDKKYPSNEEVAIDKMKLLNDIKEALVDSYHVMKKREMENYMPDEVFEDIKDNDSYIKSYLSLNATQKDYIDVENGLPDKNIAQFEPEELKLLYENLENPALNFLRKDKLILKDKLNKKISFKSNFPKYFNSDKVNRVSLKKRANSEELEEILKKISKLL